MGATTYGYLIAVDADLFDPVLKTLRLVGILRSEVSAEQDVLLCSAVKLTQQRMVTAHLAQQGPGRALRASLSVFSLLKHTSSPNQAYSNMRLPIKTS